MATALSDPPVLQRDAATRAALVEGARLYDVEPLGLERWWDGAAWSTCLVVRGGRRHRLQRLVEVGGEVVALPFPVKAAQRRLAELRASIPVLRIVPEQRRASDPVAVLAGPDGVRCPHGDCGGLLPVPAPGDPAPTSQVCPACGREPSLSR